MRTSGGLKSVRELGRMFEDVRDLASYLEVYISRDL